MEDAAVPGRAAEELLRHRPLQPRQLHLDGQRPGDPARRPRPTAPSTTQVAGAVDTTGSLRPTRTTASWSRPPGRTPQPGSNGCVYPSSVPTLFNQLDAAARQLEGLRAGPRQPGRILDGHAANPGTGQTHDAGAQYCGAPYASPGPTGSTALPEPGQRQRDRPVRAQALPVPVVRLAPATPATATRRTSPTCSTRPTASTTTCRASRRRRRSAGSRRTTAATPTTRSATATTSRAASPTPTRRTPPVNYTGGLYASDLFLEHVIPEIEASPAFKDGGLIDVTFDEGFPPFTFTGNSFANSTTEPPTAATSIASRLGRRDHRSAATSTTSRPGRTRRWRPTRAATSSTPAPATTPSSTARAPAWPRRCPAQPAGTCLLGGGSNSPGRAHRQRRDARRRAATTIADNSIVATDAGPHGDRDRHPAPARSSAR